MQDYRRLDVHSRAHTHALSTRKAVDRFPKSGFGPLKLQITRSAESIAFNIVEGCGAATQPDFARFLDISAKSAFELEYQLTLAKDYGVLPEANWTELRDETIEIRKMLYGLRRKVLKSVQAAD